MESDFEAKIESDSQAKMASDSQAREIADRLSKALDSWQDDPSPFTNFSFDKSEVLDLNDPETAMKEKRGTKKGMDLSGIGSGVEQGRDESFAIDSLPLPELTISDDTSHF